MSDTWERLLNDQNVVKAIVESDELTVAALLRQKGYDIPMEDLQKKKKEIDNAFVLYENGSELSAESLDSVAGGSWISRLISAYRSNGGGHAFGGGSGGGFR